MRPSAPTDMRSVRKQATKIVLPYSVSGYPGLGDAESRGVLNESALVSGRHIFGGHFTFPIAQTRDARALCVIILLADVRPAPVAERPFRHDRKRRFA
jgi:hypothetical protein